MTNFLLAELKEAGLKWSDYRRRQRKAWPRVNIIARIIDGCGPQNLRSNPPLVEISREASRFHRVYTTLCEDHQIILYLYYVERGKIREKAEFFDCSVATIYRKRNNALQSMVPGWREITRNY